MIENTVSAKLIVLAIPMIAVFSFQAESTPVAVRTWRSNVNFNSENSEHAIEDLSKIGRLLNLDFWWNEKGNGKGDSSLNERRNVVHGNKMPGKRNNLEEKRYEWGSEFASKNGHVLDSDKNTETRKRHAFKRARGKIVSDRKVKEKYNEKGNEQNKESDNKNEDDNNDKNMKSGGGQPERRAFRGILSHTKMSNKDHGNEQRQGKGFENEIGDIKHDNQNRNGEKNHNWRRAMAKLKLLEKNNGRSSTDFGTSAIHDGTREV